jgi:anti-sigma regulatory factor (Ser/Thr protein kinase)
MTIQVRDVRLRLPAEAASLRSARERIRTWLDDLGADDDVSADVVVAVNEACANAIEHPVGRRRPWIDLLARHDAGRVVITVADSGRWRHAARADDRGRGFRLMLAFMDEVAVERAAGGTTVRLGRRID